MVYIYVVFSYELQEKKREKSISLWWGMAREDTECKDVMSELHYSLWIVSFSAVVEREFHTKND